METKNINKIKVKRKKPIIRKEISQKSFKDLSNQKIGLRNNLYFQNEMKTLNSGITYKIKDNIFLSDLNINNDNTLNSFLSKSIYNSTLNEDIFDSKNEKIRTIEPYSHHHYLSLNLKNINNGWENLDDNNKNLSLWNSNINDNTLENKIHSSKFSSSFLKKSTETNEKKNRIEEVIINLKDYKGKKKESINETEKKIQNISFLDPNQSANNIKDNNKNEQDIKLNEFKKIYKRKTIKNIPKKNDYNINNKSQYIINKKKNNKLEKEKYIRENKKYTTLLINYRKRVGKQFIFYFKPYYYSFIKKHFLTFISNIKKVQNKSHYNNSMSKQFTKRNRYMFKSNINDKFLKNLELLHLNNSNNLNLYNSNINTENTNSYNYFSSHTTKNISSSICYSNPKKNINNFLITHNNIKFCSNEKISNNKELYRNNLELKKKYNQIVQRKKRKKLPNNDNILQKSSSFIKNESKTIDVSSSNNKRVKIKNIFEKITKMNNNIPNKKETLKIYNTISNSNMTKESIKNAQYNKIKPISRNKKERDNKIKNNILKTKSNDKLNCSFEDKCIQTEESQSSKIYYFKNTLIRVQKKKNKTKVNPKKEINNIINYNNYKKFISQNIKNIFTKDQKVNIHINYVFFIPFSKINKNSEKYLNKINKSLEIKKNYSYSYFGNQSQIKNSNKLCCIKEEDEYKSKISFPKTLQNPLNEHNSILENLIKSINYFFVKTKKSIFYKLKVINLFICTKYIIKKNIFKKLNIIKKDIKGKNDLLQINQKTNNINGIFLVDDKIIMNMNSVNFENDK